MTLSISPLFSQAILNCMAESRLPTECERDCVARRIWSDGAPFRPAFAWDELENSSADKQASIRAADLALCGLP